MTDREKLVELLAQACEWGGRCIGCKNNLPIADTCREERFGKVADHLIANGVTVQPPKKAKKPTDLTGKCGSCVYAEQTVAFGGSRCYVLCTHPERRHVKHVTYPRQRTCKACKMYKALPEKTKEDTNETGT